MRLDTPRLILRAWQDSDRAAFAQINRDPDVMKYLGPLLTRAQSDAAIDQQIKLMGHGEPAFWATEYKDSGHLIGCIGIKRVSFQAHFTPCFEIGWRLGSAFWGRGLASEGAKATLDYSFEHWDMAKIMSFTVPANLASQGVMRKIGMSRVVGGDFDHPNLAKNHPLSRHVLYEVKRGLK